MSPMMSQLGMAGLLGIGSAAAAAASSMFGGGSQYPNTRRQSSSSSGLQYSNRFKFAEGGMAQDDVPALLMNGEYVVSKDAVQKYGSNFFDKLNRGNVNKFANGGQVGPINEFKNPDIIEQMSSDSNINNQTQSSDVAQALTNLNDTLNKNTSNEGMVNNINISVNIESDGNVSENKSSSSDGEDKNSDDDSNKTSGQKMKALTEMIKENTLKTIIEQRRPGG